MGMEIDTVALLNFSNTVPLLGKRHSRRPQPLPFINSHDEAQQPRCSSLLGFRANGDGPSCGGIALVERGDIASTEGSAWPDMVTNGEGNHKVQCKIKGEFTTLVFLVTL